MKPTKNQELYNNIKKSGYSSMDEGERIQIIEFLELSNNLLRTKRILFGLIYLLITGFLIIISFGLFDFIPDYEILSIFTFVQILVIVWFLGVGIGYTWAFFMDQLFALGNNTTIRKRLKKQIDRELEFLDRYDRGLERE